MFRPLSFTFFNYLSKREDENYSLLLLGERSLFANKMNALNRLKAKLLLILGDQGISDVMSITREAILDIWHQETRRYVLHPQKLVLDVKTGFQLPDLNSVLDGNIEPLIGANINSRQACDMV